MTKKLEIMSILKFSDGITVDTSGPIRTLQLPDGWYVIGQGYLIPVESEKAALDLIHKSFTP
jgi:hypothetical protein